MEICIHTMDFYDCRRHFVPTFPTIICKLLKFWLLSTQMITKYVSLHSTFLVKLFTQAQAELRFAACAFTCECARLSPLSENLRRHRKSCNAEIELGKNMRRSVDKTKWRPERLKEDHRPDERKLNC